MLLEYMVFPVIWSVGQTKWIHPSLRIRSILIQVQPAAQPYRILRGKTPHLRLVVTEQIIMQPAFVILVLPGITQRLIDECALASFGAGDRLPLQFAEGVVVAGPAQVALGVGHLQRRAVKIGV